MPKAVAVEFVESRPYACGIPEGSSMKNLHISERSFQRWAIERDEIEDLEETIRNSECGAVVDRHSDRFEEEKIKIHQPTARVLYDFDIDLSPYVEGFMKKGVQPSPKRSKG